MPASYPEFSMFKELPAWGIYIRHAKGISLENVILVCEKKDYRKPIILDDVAGITLSSLRVSGSVDKSDPVYSYRSTGVIISKK